MGKRKSGRRERSELVLLRNSAHPSSPPALSSHTPFTIPFSTFIFYFKRGMDGEGSGEESVGWRGILYGMVGREGEDEDG